MHLKLIKNLSVPQKLVGGFLLVSVITAIVGILSYRIISGNIQTIESLISEDLTFLKDAHAISILALEHRRYEKDVFLNIGDPDAQDVILYTGLELPETYECFERKKTNEGIS